MNRKVELNGRNECDLASPPFQPTAPVPAACGFAEFFRLRRGGRNARVSRRDTAQTRRPSFLRGAIDVAAVAWLASASDAIHRHPSVVRGQYLFLVSFSLLVLMTLRSTHLPHGYKRTSFLTHYLLSLLHSIQQKVFPTSTPHQHHPFQDHHVLCLRCLLHVPRWRQAQAYRHHQRRFLARLLCRPPCRSRARKEVQGR